MSAGLDYNALMGSADHTIRLSHQLDLYQFKCIITAPFGINSSANYESPFEQFFNDKSQKLTELTTATNIAFGTDFKTFQIKTLLNTVSTWNGTQRPTFPLQIAIVRYNESEEPVHLKSAKLQSYLYPRIGEGKNEKVGVDSFLSAFLTPPGGYLPSGKTEAQGTWTLEIGQWFRATNLILVDANFEFSQAITVDGTPLYATGSLTVQPYRLVSDQEFLAYFRDVGLGLLSSLTATASAPAVAAATPSLTNQQRLDQISSEFDKSYASATAIGTKTTAQLKDLLTSGAAKLN
ncbi:PmgG-like head morphogenesis protein [Pseudomonas phage vB_PpuM-Peetri]